MNNEEQKSLFEVNKEAMQSKILELLPVFIQKELADSYSSPIKKAVEEAISAKNGEIKLLVNEVIAKMLNDDQFKKKIGEAVVSKVLVNGLGR